MIDSWRIEVCGTEEANRQEDKDRSAELYFYVALGGWDGIRRDESGPARGQGHGIDIAKENDVEMSSMRSWNTNCFFVQNYPISRFLEILEMSRSLQSNHVSTHR